MRALITENSRLYRQLLDNILSQQGFETDVCSTIATARKFVDSETYQVICVNQYLEDGDGRELIRYCNDHEINSEAPILYLTSSEKTEDETDNLCIAEIVVKQNLQQIADQIERFVETRLDPVFSEGRILFIEDSRSIAALIQSHLEQTGYKVSHFDNAEDAWQAFIDEVSYGSDAQAFDLVITDINLEGEMTGHNLVANIRALEDARGFIPIIAITGQNTDELRLSLYHSGISDFLQKPIMVEELLVRVGNLITNKRLLDKVHDQKRELYSLATTDKLTGCHNRHSLTEFSNKFISQAQRHHYPVSLLVIDLDHFKAINDTHGHAIGDLVLTEVGKLLLTSFREGDLVARFGGEEFVVLLNHCDADFAQHKAEQVRGKMESLRPNDLTVTPSIGVTTKEPGESGDFEALFARADQCVYSAKENGRNQVVYQPLND